ncbi:MAG: (Fe-S)-binding protein [Syntrophobacter sp.]
MHISIQDRIRQLLASDDVVGVLGLREEHGAVAPYVFTTAEETSRLTMEPKWALAKTAWRISRSLPAGKSLGLVCRGCDIRALEELVKAQQLPPGAIKTIGVACSTEQSMTCMCETPFPPDGEALAGVDPMSLPAVLDLSIEPGRLDRWREHFQRCIKCYGCRNACPVCVCPSCKLEEEGYVTLGMVPPEPMAFHLIRAMHVADRCVGCGACQDSCPAELPLLAFHLAMRNALRERTGYISGTPAVSPLLTVGREEGPIGTAGPVWEDTLESCRDRDPV